MKAMRVFKDKSYTTESIVWLNDFPSCQISIPYGFYRFNITVVTGLLAPFAKIRSSFCHMHNYVLFT